MRILEFLFVPTILFMTIVAPIWIAMHYNYSRKSSKGLDQGDREVVEELLVDLDKMTERIATLESILDHENSGWRSRQTEGRQESEAEPLRRNQRYE